MKKILSITLISALTLVLSTGCSSKSDSAVVPASTAEKRDAKVSKEALYVNTHDNNLYPTPRTVLICTPSPTFFLRRFIMTESEPSVPN